MARIDSEICEISQIHRAGDGKLKSIPNSNGSRFFYQILPIS